MTDISKNSYHLQPDNPAMTNTTTEIVNDFCQAIDTDKEYSLKELKTILTDVYNSKNGKKSKAKSPKIPKAPSPKPVSESSDDDEDKPKKRGRPVKAKLDKDGNPKVKKAPSAYNIYVKQTIETMKKDSPETPAKDLMAMAAGKWKALSDDEKAAFKAGLVHDEDSEE
jgi:hypothetical protein